MTEELQYIFVMEQVGLKAKLQFNKRYVEWYMVESIGEPLEWLHG